MRGQCERELGVRPVRRPTYQDVQPVRDLVTDEEAYEAMQYMDNSAHDFGVAIAHFEYADYQVKMAEAAGVLVSSETSDAKRQADARTSPQYEKAIKARYKAQLKREEMKAKREAAQIKVEVWRT